MQNSKDRQRKRCKLQRIVEFAERPDFDFNHAVQEEWQHLRESRTIGGESR